MIKFSIIIPVRAVNDFLEENIRHIKKLSYNNYEVIIVFDYKNVYDFKDDRFKALFVGPKGPGEKRNIGVKHCSGDVIVFLDDDAYPHSEWLTEAAKILEDPNIYALGFPSITPPDAPFMERMGGRLHESPLVSGSFYYRHVRAEEREINDYPTVNLFVRKKAFDAVGGFITEFWPGEDTKLCLDLVNHHKRNFLYHPKPIVYHHRRKLFYPHLYQLSRYGRHRGQFIKIFPKNSPFIPYFIPALFVLGLIFGPLLSYFIPTLWYVYGFVIALYTFLVLQASIKVVFKEKSIKAGVVMLIGIFFTHLVYGTNILIGYIKRPTLKLRDFDEKTGNYIKG